MAGRAELPFDLEFRGLCNGFMSGSQSCLGYENKCGKHLIRNQNSCKVKCGRSLGQYINLREI